MENLRATQEKDLADCIESEFGSDIILTSPDGTIYDKNANDLTKNLRAKVRFFTEQFDPETGGSIIVHKPVVSIRISSLTVVPADGENWYIQMPVSPEVGATVDKFLFTPDRAIEDGVDMGFIKIYPTKPEQI